ncbi:SDR family oxidoreductase [Alteromonas flava]|uniref:SDR family oxidoreductase n=1 Tax=Alteromonas flava TaxID=2048003 RepID=UPI0013DD7728|nr:SDR family oxidoreductase [Alteromonas flava]
MTESIKRCLVTGASGGIGSAIARALDAMGYTIILQGRNQQKLTAVQASMSNRTTVMTGDLRSAQECEAVLEKTFADGDIDLLVNAAGVSEFSAFEKQSAESIAAQLNTNLVAPILFTQAFLHHSQQRSPAATETIIVNVGSAFGYIGYPGFSTYCASKFGLRGFTEALAREYSDSRYKFIYFAPRATKTDINSANVNAMNTALGNTVDATETVAAALIQLLRSKRRESVVGWPEKLFVRINGVLPNIVDNAIDSKLATIKRYLHA